MVLSYLWKQKDQYKDLDRSRAYWGGQLPAIYILWTRYFMQEQGYDMEPSIRYQDNMSVILLETNGWASYSNQTKPIKVKYLFIKDMVNQCEIVLKHFPSTNQMWTDVNIKPKQGATYREFWSHMMGMPVDYNDKEIQDNLPHPTSRKHCPP